MSTPTCFVERLKAGQEPVYERRLRGAVGELKAVGEEIEDRFGARECLFGPLSGLVSQLKVSADFVERYLPEK